ncbi:FHA domain-containing protein [Rhodanobacter sp. Col0626]|uniref:FHA domain-containing protein n=1 Tax=Rhodanobacter sp. Col0626 TaxID=3415679 RepID=UPI003CEE286D
MSSMPANLSKSKATRHNVEKSPRVQLSLRVLTGTHAGAEIRLPDRGILMIGHADDCDLILADEGIAAHHCVLTVVGDQVLLRAMDGSVATHDGPIAVGENITLEHFAVAHLDGVQLAVGPHWNERWQSLTDAAGTGASMFTKNQLDGRRRGLLSVVALLLLVAMLVLFGSWKVNHPIVMATHTADQQLGQAQAILGDMSLRHVKASVGDDNRLLIRGVVNSAAQLPQLKSRLSAASLNTELTVRDWPSVAKQVNDIFAMHGYTVETTMLDQGDIVVAGHFGDHENGIKVQKEVLGSSDMQKLGTDLLGLRLATKNYDETPEGPPQLPPGKRIRHVSSGEDSYLITRDDSRYYPGATLPQGGVFLAVSDNGNILVRMPDNSLKQLERDDDYTIPHTIDETSSANFLPAGSASAAAPAASASVGVPADQH